MDGCMFPFIRATKHCSSQPKGDAPFCSKLGFTESSQVLSNLACLLVLEIQHKGAY